MKMGCTVTMEFYSAVKKHVICREMNITGKYYVFSISMVTWEDINVLSYMALVTCVYLCGVVWAEVRKA